MSDLHELIQRGDLQGAVAASLERVRNHPADIPARSLLAELLCFTGDLERADKQLDALLRTDPSSLHGVSLMRHLIRAEVSRREVFEQGRIPEFSGPPSPALELRLRALTEFRNGCHNDAAALIQEAGELESELSGTVDGRPFTGFSDLDAILGPVLEVFTATGACYWIDCAQILRLDFEPVAHLSDTLWRAASIQTVDGIDGRVHIPALYYGSEKSSDPRVTLGRTTEWITSPDADIVRGAGQREFLTGDDVSAILSIRSLIFAPETA